MARFEKAVLVTILLMVIAAFFAYLEGFVLTSTRYAAQYGENAFDRIKQGDQAETVLASLGEPLSAHTNQICVTWTYSEPKPRWWAQHWKVRAIVVSDGKVVKKFEEVWGR